MATVTLDDGSLYDIADAIRSKLGVSTTYLPSEMAAAIMSIENQEIIQGYYIANNFFEDSAYTIPIFGEFGKIYVDLSNGGLYRYNGNGYTELSEGLRLGETDSTAYRGDRGKIAYDHAQARGNEYSSGLYKIRTNAEGHVTEATAVQKSDITSLGIPAYDTTYEETSEEEDGLFTWEEKLKLMNIEARATYDMPHDHDPLMDGTASAGTYNSYARGDHRHPTDTTRMAADLKGAANGVAELDAGGKVPSSQLPSYVDDVLEYPSQSDLPATGETGKIYVTTDTNTTYRWSGSAYVPVSNPLDYATQAEAEAGAENTHVMTALRTKQAIDANAYELPLMSESTRGGAKLGHGLTVEDGALGIGEVTDATDAGPIVELMAKGWATQDGTPSPSYPQEIKVCRGRNLLDTSGVSHANLRRNEDGTIVVTSQPSAAFSVTLDTIDFKAGVTYTLSGGYANNAYVYVNIDGSALSSGLNPVTFTPSADQTKTVGMVVQPTTPVGATYYPQLELGSVAHPYVPYGCVGVDVQGRNLAANDLGIIATNGITFAPQEDGGIKITGTASANAFYWLRNTSAGIPLDAGTYVASSDIESTSNIIAQVGYIMQSGGELVYLWSSTTNYPSFDVPSGTYGVGWRVYVKSGATVNATVHLQIERGYKTSYVPYAKPYSIPIPLPSRGWVAALPDGTCDTLTLDGAGGYEWTLNVKELVFDGVNVKSDGGVTNSAGVSRYYHRLSDSDSAILPSSINSLPDIYASHFVRKSSNYTWGNTDSCISINNATQIVFLHDSLNGVAFNTWLQSNNVTVLYPLATPTTESGYVDSMPTVPVHAAISSTDLHDLAVRCCADEGAAEIASAWGRRYEERIATLESAVATLVAAGS